MPCYDPRDHESDEILRERLNAATRAACEMFKVFRAAKLIRRLSEETIQWGHEHERSDAQQRVSERSF